MRSAWFLIVLASCMNNSDLDERYTGESRRYVVDMIQLPQNSTAAREYGADLNGDTTVDNQLGMVIGTLAGQGLVTTHGGDMIAAGAIASSVQIVADDLRDDPTVSVQYDGEGAVVGGAFVDGSFVSDRRHAPGSARLRLPVFVDADPIILELTSMEIELEPDGRGGFDGYVRGAVEEAVPAAFTGITQMLANDPNGHLVMLGLLDANRDRVVTYEEFSSNSLIQSLLAPDLELDGRRGISFGFRIHLAACPNGSCAGAIVDTCHDRVVDGDESDIDCGGACRSCEGEASCAIDADCTSEGCDAGTCRAPTCTDGVRDGFETDLDCGSGCDPCPTGDQCWTNADCESGICGRQCTEADPYGCVRTSLDTCR